MKFAPNLLAALVFFASSSIANASIITIENITIDGLQPADPTFSDATGNATVVLNTDTRFVEISGTFEGLSTPAFAAHLHGPADFGEFSPRVLIQLDITNATSGTFSASRSVSPTNFQTILDSLSYINIHTDDFPTGEIRGQIVVPSPGAFAMFFALPAIVIRRSRR